MHLQPAFIATSLAVAALTAGQAGATETVSCSGVDGSDALIDMNVGQGLPAIQPNWVRVAADGRQWSTLGPDVESGMTPATIYQTFDDGRMMMIDLADEPVSETIIAIRILAAEEGERKLRVGYLHVLGSSLHPVLCDFGESE